MELTRIFGLVTSRDVRDALKEALSRGEGYELILPGEGAEGSGEEGTVTRNVDVVLVELDDGAEGLSRAERVRSGAPGRPVILIGSGEREKELVRAVQHGFSDYLLTDTMYPAVIQRAVRHGVEHARAERRRKQAERALGESEQRYRSLFEQSRDAIYMTDRDGEILELNRAALELLGYTADELIGRNVRMIYGDPSDRDRFEEAIEAEGFVQDFEVRLVTREGRDRWCLVSSWVRRDASGQVDGYQGIIHDITERKSVEDQLVHEAFHDTLTGLPNRSLFMDRLERAVARRRRGEERQLAVLFLDMDRFKVVNDSLGHLGGDELLRRMARLLMEEVREEDTVARIGGDEFAILLDGVDDAADPTHVAERIQRRLREPMRIHGQDVFTSMSIGIALGGAGVESPEALLRSADTAMYRAKELGPARYQIFDEAMHAHAVTLLQLETDLRLALERDQFVVHYQPLMGLADRDRLVGFEALVRWEHPEQGLIQPQAFIPVAEDTGLIVPLGAWVLREAVRELREWRRTDPSLEDLFVSVNLSARQFGATDLAGTVAEILEEEGLEPACLRLEITESAMMMNPSVGIATLSRLRQLGVTLCIDDFGTGYSSLNTLHELPVDVLKIDRSFIQRLEAEDEGQMVATILALARNLGMSTVAEGVETEAQLGRLRALGSGTVQGFFFSEPLAPDAVRRLLEKRRQPAE